jgi:type VI secretion system secreted protein VgrG
MSPNGRGAEPQFLFKVSDVETRVVSFSVAERVSAPFEIDLKLASEDEIEFKKVIGQPGVLTLLGDAEDRYFHGIVNKFVQTGMIGRFNLYQAKVVPSLWLLCLEQDCRIFQEKTTQDIVKQILEETGITSDLFEFRLQNKYDNREYCVQYQETDLNFISRLLEEEGIFYFFEHSADKHLLIFGDSTVNYLPIPGEPQVKFNPTESMVPEEEAVTQISLSRRIRSGKVTLRDFNFEKPSLDLTAEEKADENEKLEIYDYPGIYKEENIGTKLALLRLQEIRMYKDKAEGQSYCPRFIPGFTFKLIEHEMDTINQEYLLTEVLHSGSQPQELEEYAGEEAGLNYLNQFFAIPASIPVRPKKNTPIPVVEGIQTAIVTGPSGEEIYTDEHGRVKVQFHWDREGKRDENSSCWIRVSQGWAGAGWGAMYIPRIDQEVIVDFIDGKLDNPIITGRVYHGENKPPLNLPDEKTKSTIKSDSSTGGGGSNELRFEDKKGSEEIFLHGQKDWTIAIDNDKNQTVGNNESLTVGSNRTKSVGTDQSETIGANKTIKVGSNHTENIGANMTQSVGSNKSETISIAKALAIGAAYQVSVGAAMNETVGAAKAEEIGVAKSVNVGANSSENVGINKSVDAGSDISEKAGKNFSIKAGDNYSVDAGKDVTMKSGKKMNLNAGDDYGVKGAKKGVIDIADELLIQCGSASIKLKKNGDITISGKKIEVTGTQDIKLNAMKITSEASTKSMTKGAMVNVEASGINTIKGSLVKIN